MQTLSMILACKGGKTIRVKENIFPFLISTLSGTLAKHRTVFGPCLLPYPLCRPAGDIQVHRQPWCLGKKFCGSWRVRPALSNFVCGKKRSTANNQMHLSNKNQMGHQAGSPPSTKWDLGWAMGKADRKPLRKQECGWHQWQPLKMPREPSLEPNRTWLGIQPSLRKAVAMVDARAWDVRGMVQGLSKRWPWSSRRELPWGWWGVTRKGKGFLVKIIVLSSYFARWGTLPNSQAKQ